MNNENTFVNIAAPGVRGLHPYQPGKPIEELQREFGINDVIKLASNENPLGPSALVLDALDKESKDLARYPDGNGFGLKSALAKQLNVAMKQITLGNGSNDVLELIARAFATQEEEVIYSQYAFAVYPIVTQAVNAKHVVTAAKQWGHDLNAMLGAISENTKIIFIANPNNPTGTWISRDGLLSFLQQVPKTIIVVIDEAYFEYASHPLMNAPDYPNAMNWLEDFPNLIVTRTFSKAYGLASLRVGFGVSHPDVADILNRVRQPFNVNSFALRAATVALGDNAYLENSVQLNAKGMQQIVAACTHLGLNYIPSIGNFICIDVGRDAGQVYEMLLRKGVIVRPVANYGMPTFLRVSIGAEQENAIFIDALTTVLGA